MKTADALEAMTVAYADAVWAKDAARLAALYDAEVRVFDAWGCWSYEGLEAWRANLEAWLGSLGDEGVRVGFEDVRSSATGEMGVLSGVVTYAAVDTSGAVIRSLQNRLTWALARRGDGWAIVHEHTSAPIGDDGKALLRRE